MRRCEKKHGMNLSLLSETDGYTLLIGVSQFEGYHNAENGQQSYSSFWTLNNIFTS